MGKLKEENYTYSFSISMPEKSSYTCFLFGGSSSANCMAWTPDKGEEPNWFWRLMQYLILGNKWVKNE